MRRCKECSRAHAVTRAKDWYFSNKDRRRAYDEQRQVFPTSLLASAFNFTSRDYFEIETVEVRSAPDVRF
jgi:hypothetical protein